MRWGKGSRRDRERVLADGAVVETREGEVGERVSGGSDVAGETYGGLEVETREKTDKPEESA